MGFFKKKVDPISARAKALSAQIAALEAQIKEIDSKIDDPRASDLPQRPRVPLEPASGRAASTLARAPVFETNDFQRGHKIIEAEATPPHFNDLGVRKYDLTSAWKRLQNIFRGPTSHNPKLVSYLAAGSIKGLRPLRYEKRVARNRFIALLVILLLLIWGVVAIFVRH